MSFSERLKEIRGELNQTKFGKLLGVTRNTIQRYESGEREPCAAFIVNLSSVYKINFQWLLTGEGPMKRGEEVKPTQAELDDNFLRYIDQRLSEMEQEEPGIRAWFRVQCKRKFPDLFDQRKEHDQAEVGNGEQSHKVA